MRPTALQSSTSGLVRGAPGSRVTMTAGLPFTSVSISPSSRRIGAGQITS